MKTQNITIKTGTYTDKAGKERASWLNVGRLITNDKGQQTVFLDAIPADPTAPLYVFDRKKEAA